MIQPLDIKSQAFKKGIFGYKTSDVDSYVNTVYRAYDDLFRENEALTKKLNGAESSLQEARLKIFDLENQVNKIENVSTYGDDETGDAKKKADQIIKNAEAAAAEIIANAKKQSQNIESGKDVKDTAKAAPVEEPVVEEKKSMFTVKTNPTQTGPKPFVKTEEKPQEEAKESASSRFFKKSEDAATKVAPAVEEDDDEIFVGEIEDARKPDRMMIGDGEEEEDLDFEFL